MQGGEGAIELAFSFRAVLEPAEPVEDAAVGGADAVFEGVAAVVIEVEAGGEAELAEVIDANGLVRFLFSLGERGEEQRSENGDDGDHHQEFDQCKCASASHDS